MRQAIQFAIPDDFSALKGWQMLPQEHNRCQGCKGRPDSGRYLLRPPEVGFSPGDPLPELRCLHKSDKGTGIDMDEMLTLKETRDILKVSRNTMYMLVRDGVIPARKVGSEWRIMRSTLVDWMKQREN